MAIKQLKLIEKLAAKFGFARIQTIAKNWSNDWLKIREYNLLQQGTKVTNPYSQSSDVYKAVKAIADNIGQANLEFYKGEKETTHPDLERLFRAPNPLMSRSQLWEATAMFLSLNGRCFWMFNKSVGELAGTGRKLPAEIWVFNPSYFSAVRDANTGMLIHWLYRGQIVIQPDELLYFRYFNPYDPIDGMSPYAPIAKTVDLDYQSLNYNSKFFMNNAEPGYVLSTDQALTDEQFNRLKTQWDKEHKGLNNAHKIAILEGGLKPASVGTTHKDMEFIEQRKLNREDVLGIWRVPKSMFSITDDLNYATFQGQKKLFWTDTLMPILKYVEEVLNGHFFPKYTPGIEGYFDYSAVASLQEDLNALLDRATKLFAMGVPFNTINERLDLGFDKIIGGDVGYLPYSLMPVTPETLAQQIAPPEPIPAPAPAPDPEKQTKNIVNENLSKRFVMLHDPMEKTYEKILKDYFYRQRGKALASLGKSVKLYTEIVLDWTNENNELIKLSSPVVQQAVRSGADFANALVGGSIDFNLLNPSLSSVIQSRFARIPELNNTIREQLRAELTVSLAGGETTDQIAERIRSVYNLATSRSKVIARTEITGAMNGGTFAAFKSAGITKKMWVTSHDDKVRESHQDIDSETVGIDHIFSNGVDFPGGHGPAEEVINCRCNLRPILD